MLSNSSMFGLCKIFCLLIFCAYCTLDEPYVFGFLPNDALLGSHRKALQSSTTIAMATGKNEITAPNSPTTNAGTDERKSRLVWLTGVEDLRIHDHGGFIGAFSDALINNGDDIDEAIIPVFVIDQKTHLRSRSPSVLKRLHASLTALERTISSLSKSSSIAPLVIRSGSPSQIIPALAHETNAVACHVVEDDVVRSMRTAQQSTCASLAEMGVNVVRWTNRLRQSAPWSSNESKLPSFFPDYCELADALPIEPPDDGSTINKFMSSSGEIVGGTKVIPSEGVPSFEDLLDMAEAATPKSVLEARSSRQPFCDTTEPFDTLISNNWSSEEGARKALAEYCLIGNDEFTNKHFIASDAANKGSSNGKSMYASSTARILRSSSQPKECLALREGPTRAFSSALNLGAISARNIVDAARNRSPVTPPVFLWDKKKNNNASNLDTSRNIAGLYPSDNTLWGRSSEGRLSDVVEWREWFHLLAQRSLRLQETDEKETIRDKNYKTRSGDPRERGTVNYWRWKGQHLVRYLTFPAGKDYEEQDEEMRDPAVLLVHGFAASGEQWERLVYSIRQGKVKANDGKDTTPPIYAVDLLGFGHSEKPGLSYTQYLWESQLVDFAIEVMEAVPMVMVSSFFTSY